MSQGFAFSMRVRRDAISVLHCSPYIREWMSRERSRPKARAHKRKKEEAPLEDEDGKARIGRWKRQHRATRLHHRLYMT